MADINVEPKTGGGSKWLWIVIAIVIIAAILYYVLGTRA
ncbi:MAG TPA: LPXTG cell wall anchor domain-containing protein [Longimicrobiales bacterium]|nr:LPXTG cell wall anchor domain-containing protein [Longimicrobiales bacterium]